MNTFSLRFIAVLILAVVIHACSGGDPNIESAKLNIRNQDYTAAIASVDKALEANPDNAEAYVWKARALSARALSNPNISARQSDYEAMNTALDRADAIYKNSTDPKAILASLQLGDIRDEAWRMEHATGVNHVNHDSVTDADIQTAIQHMKNAVAIYPDSTLSARVLSEIYFMGGNTSEAANYLQTVLNKPGVRGDTTDYVRLIYFLRESNRDQELDAALAKATAEFPGSKEIKIEVANTQLSRQQYDQAAETMSSIVQMDPANAEYRYIYATLVFEAINTQISNINENYNKSYELRTEYRNLARQSTSAANTARMAEIDKELETIAADNNRVSDEIDRLGGLVSTQLEQAIQLKPEEAKYHALLGSMYDVQANVMFNEGNETSDLAQADSLQTQAKQIWEKALPYMKRATELDESNPEYWSALSKIYIRLGMNDEAQKAMERSEQ